jgi:hypothetical protein
MNIEILEPSIVLVFDNDFGVPSPLVEGVEYGKLLKEKIVDIEWGFEDSRSHHPYHRETKLKNGLFITADVNKLTIKHSPAKISEHFDLVAISKKLATNFNDLVINAVGINFKAVLETTSGDQLIDPIFFDILKKKVTTPKFSAGVVKLLFECEDSKLNLNVGTGMLTHIPTGAIKNGIVFDANFHTDLPTSEHLKVFSLLETQADKKALLKTICQKLFE